MSAPYEISRYDYRDFTETVYLPFEMLSLPAPAGYENRLRVTYGPWRTPTVEPPPHLAILDVDNPSETYMDRSGILNGG